MAAKFVVAVALFGLCHANPAIISGAVSRDGRAYAVSQANGKGANVAQATVQGGPQWARDGSPNGYPGQANAQAQTSGAGQVFAQAGNQGSYYRAPAVIGYEQNFAVPTFEIPAVRYASNTASSSANSEGNGVAESSAKTQEGYGTSTYAKTDGQGSAKSNAQTGGAASYVPVENQEQVPEEIAIIDAKTPVLQTAYVPVASAKANVNGPGQAASSAKTSGRPVGRTISWRFGTLYDKPSAYAQANTQSGYGAAKSAANTQRYGVANANADVNGYGSAKSSANTQSGFGEAKSYATNSGYGNAKSAANVYGSQYGGSRAAAQAATRGYGSAQANAQSY